MKNLPFRAATNGPLNELVPGHKIRHHGLRSRQYGGQRGAYRRRSDEIAWLGKRRQAIRAHLIGGSEATE